jgi:hypothetical protein
MIVMKSSNELLALVSLSENFSIPSYRIGTCLDLVTVYTCLVTDASHDPLSFLNKRNSKTNSRSRKWKRERRKKKHLEMK